MLDERTILVMMAVLPGRLALVAVGLRVGHPADVRGIGSWAWALLCYSFASALAAMWVGAPFGPRLLLSNAFFTSAVSLLGFSVARFFGRPLRPKRWVLATLVVYLLAALLTQRIEQAPLRIALFSVQLLAMIAVGVAATLASGELRRGLGAKVLLLALLLMGVAAAMRLGAAVLGFAPVTLMAGGTSSLVPTFLAMINVGMVLGTLGLVLLASERMRQRLEDLASHDTLTGLLIRGGFAALAEHAIANARRERQWLGFLLVDIDFFKAINDQYGHQAGDALLVTVARTLRDQAREVDLVSRFGGEEFALLLPHSDPNQTRKAAERLRSKVESVVVVHAGRELKATISIGAVAMLAESASIEALYRAADEALYRAKDNGRNRIEVAVDVPVA